MRALGIPVVVLYADTVDGIESHAPRVASPADHFSRKVVMVSV